MTNHLNMNTLRQIIINQIREEKTNHIPFDQFINLALYHPELGYYNKNKKKIGKNGDFYTAPFLTDLFAEVVFDYCSSDLKKRSRLDFCEIGAGTGKFLNGWFTYAKKKYKDQLNKICYYAIESSRYHQELLKEYPFQVKVLDGLQLLHPIEGVIFANELLDALPVKVITTYKGDLCEVVVGERDGVFYQTLETITDVKVLSFIKKYQLEPKEGHKMEVPIILDSIFPILSQKLESGKLIVIDYMYPVNEWKLPELKEGSLRGYKNHQLMKNVLETPGDMDITYHLPLELITSIAIENGFSLIESVRQDEFFINNGILEKLKSHSISDPFHPLVKRNRAIQSLISPSGMSPYFHVLIFEK
ncbi:MAG TPA: SAM-dependent methyltransferase [Bacillus sp. (in: firmicutes)]|uniref:SAM-dependent methyltransferase n=1 Tax=Bacillus litorisediminis TaxID=2922713 RepID=UPI001FAF94C5|nr:SAM-dependent methyltransferase [Bacillus litorisediminis]HWO77626.1 SAM-dependent methyltransferase [Bacillus sp. (in: firmicutes)]